MEDTDKAVDIWGNTKDQQKQKSLDTDLLKKHVHSTVKKKRQAMRQQQQTNFSST